MGPPSYMRSVVDRNVVLRRVPVYMFVCVHACVFTWQAVILLPISIAVNSCSTNAAFARTVECNYYHFNETPC